MGLVTNKREKSFAAMVGVNDEVGPYGSVVFQVFADGVKIFDSGTIIGGATTKLDDVSFRNQATAGSLHGEGLIIETLFELNVGGKL